MIGQGLSAAAPGEGQLHRPGPQEEMGTRIMVALAGRIALGDPEDEEGGIGIARVLS